MIRSLIQLLAIFLLPFLLYAAYFLVMRARTKPGQDRPTWEDGPWFWLVVSGLVLALLGFIAFDIFRETSTNIHSVRPPVR